MKVFDVRWDEIPQKDWPKYNEVFVCKDPQERLGENTWLVGNKGPSRKLEDDYLQVGLFWHKQWALEFAVTLENSHCNCEGGIRWGNPDCEVHMHV